MKNSNFVDSIFSQKGNYQAAVLCTYGLNLHFFENYLMKLDALFACNNITVFTDPSTYDDLVTDSYKPRWLNKKYLVNRVKAGGVFHTKLYILASEKRAIVGLGSANLTRDGLTSNLELISTFEITANDLTYSRLLLDCIEYVERIAIYTKSDSAIEQIGYFRQVCNPLTQESGNKYDLRILHNMDKCLIEQIVDSLKENEVETIRIISPFYDHGLAPLYEFKKYYPEAKYEIYIQQGKSNFPKDIFTQAQKITSINAYHGEDRFLHGKAILFEFRQREFVVMGSANFTRAALLSTPKDGNFEAILLGEIDKGYGQEIVYPNGILAQKVSNADEIRVDLNLTEVDSSHKRQVDYIIEAVLEGTHIKIIVDTEVKGFKLNKIRILDFSENFVDRQIGHKLIVELDTEIKKLLPGKKAVQILMQNAEGNEFASNISWVIELEDQSQEPSQRWYRKIYNSPFELQAILWEILEQGDEDELKLFLLRFDIPLDIILPPRNVGLSGLVGTKGNLEGVLPEHHGYLFDSAMLIIYENSLERLFHKLQQHRDNVQPEKINNLLLILSGLYSLISFLNSLILNRFQGSETITSDDWVLIRDFYDMMLKYLDRSWTLVWGLKGYAEIFNIRNLQNQEPDDLEQHILTFNEHLNIENTGLGKVLARIALRTANDFVTMRKKVKIKVNDTRTVQPQVFKSRHMYLQEGSINETRKNFNILITDNPKVP